MNNRTKLLTKLAFVALVSTVIFVACQNQDESISPDTESFDNFVSEGSQMVLGE